MDNKRFLVPSLWVVFFFSLYMLWNAWQRTQLPPPPPPGAQPVSSVPGAPVPSTPATPTAPTATPAANPVADVGQLSSAASVASKAETVTIKTDLFRVHISSMGGDIVEMALNNYKLVADKSKDFLLFEPKHQYLAQSGLIGENLPTHKTLFSPVAGERELAAGQDSLEFRLEAPVLHGVKVTKVYTFKRGSYLIAVRHEIENSGQKEIVGHAYFQIQRDNVTPEGESSTVSTFTGPAVYTEQEKYQKIDFSDIEKSKAKFVQRADNGWVAMVQHFFVSAWIPEEKVNREFYMKKLDAAVAAGVILPVPNIAPGAKFQQTTYLFAGPQIQSVLKSLEQAPAQGGLGAKGLPLVVDYGALTIVAAPIFWSLDFIYKIVGNWGWAIIILTIIIKLIFFPLSAASYKSMAKMRAVTPRLTALKERYGKDKQKLNQEMMNLYKSEKINPLGGCLPIVIQIPVFIALYWALLGAVEMRDAPWMFWIHDLSSKDPYYVLPVLMVITMVIQTKLNPAPPDPMQAKVMMAMPFIFGAMFLFFPSGLVLYWVVNNLLSIAQQWQITRMIERGTQAANAPKR